MYTLMLQGFKQCAHVPVCMTCALHYKNTHWQLQTLLQCNMDIIIAITRILYHKCFLIIDITTEIGTVPW
jgi:hypothetical protein